MIDNEYAPRELVAVSAMMDLFGAAINPKSSLRPCLRRGGPDRYYIVIEHSWVRRYPSSDRQKPVRVSDDPAAADTEDD